MARTTHPGLWILAAGMTMCAAGAGGVGWPGGTAAEWGPPMICSEIKIGEAKTLPAPAQATSGYARKSLVPETLALLEPKTPVLVRMETIRRALVIGNSEPAALHRLFTGLLARVLDQESRDKEDALAWFDAGYMAAAWSEHDRDDAPEVGLAEGCIGYAWLRRAMALAKNPAEMEFAAALATHPAMHKGTYDVYQGHITRAAGGATRESLLEQNLKAHCATWNESYEQHRKKGGSDK